jgi:hypothetical protein
MNHNRRVQRQEAGPPAANSQLASAFRRLNKLEGGGSMKRGRTRAGYMACRPRAPRNGRNHRIQLNIARSSDRSATVCEAPVAATSVRESSARDSEGTRWGVQWLAAGGPADPSALRTVRDENSGLVSCQECLNFRSWCRHIRFGCCFSGSPKTPWARRRAARLLSHQPGQSTATPQV